MDDKKRIEVTFFGHNVPFLYSIVAKLTDEEKKIRQEKFLGEMERSISKKRYILTTLVDDSNLELIEINKELMKRTDYVKDCIKNNTAYHPENEHHFHRILAYTEAALFQLKALCEIIKTYLFDFYEYYLKKSKVDCLSDLAKKAIDLAWIEDLGNLRNDLLHNYSSWIFLEETDSAFTFGLKLPHKFKLKSWQKDTVTVDDLNGFYSEFSISFNKIADLINEKIIEKRAQES